MAPAEMPDSTFDPKLELDTDGVDDPDVEEVGDAVDIG